MPSTTATFTFRWPTYIALNAELNRLKFTLTYLQSSPTADRSNDSDLKTRKMQNQMV